MGQWERMELGAENGQGRYCEWQSQNEDISIAILGEKARKLGAPSRGREVEMFTRKAKQEMCVNLQTEPRLNDPWRTGGN